MAASQSISGVTEGRAWCSHSGWGREGSEKCELRVEMGLAEDGSGEQSRGGTGVSTKVVGHGKVSTAVYTQWHHHMAKVRPPDCTYRGMDWLTRQGRRRWKSWTPRIKGHGTEGSGDEEGYQVTLTDWSHLHQWPVTDCLVGWEFSRKEKHLVE